MNTTYTPFLCRVTPYGTPHFVPCEPMGHPFTLDQLPAENICRLYWLLESIDIHYEMTFSGSLDIKGCLSLGKYAPVPRVRLIEIPTFSASLFHTHCGVVAQSYIDFSKIYSHQNEDKTYAIDFRFEAFNRTETVNGSDFLLSFGRDPRNNGKRDRYKSKIVHFLGKDLTVYLNYNSQIWADDQIELGAFDITTTFYENSS